MIFCISELSLMYCLSFLSFFMSTHFHGCTSTFHIKQDRNPPGLLGEMIHSQERPGLGGCCHRERTRPVAGLLPIDHTLIFVFRIRNKILGRITVQFMGRVQDLS